MVTFFKDGSRHIIAVESAAPLSEDYLKRLSWLFDGATPLKSKRLDGIWIGPRKEMVTPWSTNAVEITQNMGIEGITRIEEYFKADSDTPSYDKMLQRLYPDGLNQTVFNIDKRPDPIVYIDDLAAYESSQTPRSSASRR